MVTPTQTASPAEGFLSARFHVIPGEDPAEFEALVRDYRRQFPTVGPAEAWFLQTMILCDWKKRRFAHFEVRALAAVKPSDEGKESYVLKSIAREQRYQERTYFRAYKELRQLQLERRKAALAETKPELKPEVAQAATANAAAPSPQTGGIGFVSQKPATPAASPAPIPHIDLSGRTYKEGLVFVG